MHQWQPEQLFIQEIMEAFLLDHSAQFFCSKKFRFMFGMFGYLLHKLHESVEIINTVIAWQRANYTVHVHRERPERKRMHCVVIGLQVIFCFNNITRYRHIYDWQ